MKHCFLGFKISFEPLLVINLHFLFAEIQTTCQKGKCIAKHFVTEGYGSILTPLGLLFQAGIIILFISLLLLCHVQKKKKKE